MKEYRLFPHFRTRSALSDCCSKLQQRGRADIKTSHTAGLYQRDMTYKVGAPDTAKEQFKDISFVCHIVNNISPISADTGIIEIVYIKNLTM
jgi:hypothetical protein